MRLTHRFVLEQLRMSRPDAQAVFCGDQVLTFAQLDRVTERVAAGLQAAGLEPGDRVAWMGRNSLEYFVLYFATAKANLVVAPFNYWLRRSDIADALRSLDPRAMLGQKQYAELLVDAAAEAGIEPALVQFVKDGSGDRPVKESFGFLDLDAALQEVADDESVQHEVIFTSGTTGPARAVIRSQRKRVLDSYLSAGAFEFTSADHVLHLGPQFHVGGMAMANQVMYVGGAVSIAEFSPEAVVDALGHGVTFMAGVPTHFAILHESGLVGPEVGAGVKAVKLAGSSTPPPVYAMVHAMLPNADLCNGWGMTESGPHTVSVRGDDLVRRPGTIGLCVPGNAVRVVGTDGVEVDTDLEGELQIKSLTLMDGYLLDPERTAAAFTPDGWYRTGDLGRQDADGYFYLSGRASDMIITGGENVHPALVERVLSEMPGVTEIAVVGVPDAKFVERVVAVVRGDSDPTVTEAAVVEFARARLARFRCPTEVWLVPDFPHTATGKVSRSALRDLVIASATASSGVPARRLTQNEDQS